MPDRPDSSFDFLAQYNDVLRRLRAVERLLPGQGDAFDPLQTLKGGELLGDTRFLDFGTGISAEALGGDYVRISSAQSESPFDAIVDGHAATNEQARIFGDGALALSNCLAYLANDVGLTSCVVGVRPYNNPTSPTGYAEAADWIMPLQTRLFGLRGTAPATISVAASDGFAWDIGNFKGRTPLGANPNLRIENCIEFDVAQTTSDLRFGTVWAYDTYFDVALNPGAGWFCDNMYGRATTWDFVTNNTNRVAQTRMVLLESDLSRVSSIASLMAGTSLELLDCNVANGNITLPASFVIDIYTAASRAPSASTPPSFTVPAASKGVISVQNSLGNGCVVTATANFTELKLIGDFAQITATGTHTSLILSDLHINSGLCDITGPADINAVASGDGRFRFRGEGVAGTVAGDALTGTSTFVDFVGADRCSIVVGADPGSGPRKAYAFDANSDRNALLFPGHSTGWTTGTDLGTGNRVLPEGSGPFSVNGHVIEDEGVALTQRANMNFVGAGVTATDSGGKTLVTIPGGGSDGLTAADWMAF